MKPIATLDLEIYPDYFLAAFRRQEDGVLAFFEMFEGDTGLNIDGIRKALAKYQIVTFNGNHFDLPLLGIALAGSNCQKLKEACDKIIRGKLKAWDIERQYEIGAPACDHIDLIEVAPGFSSLKVYGGRMHCQRLQDLPIDPDDSIRPDDRAVIREYCANDLVLTAALFDLLKPQIDLRCAMTEQYGIDLRSKSDAQIAEAIIGREVASERKSKITRPRINVGTTYQYATPPWITFNSPDLCALLAEIQSAEFAVGAGGSITMPPVLSDRQITLGTSTYRLGIGGLHSSEQSVAHIADADTLILDRDVASYYPSIILRCGLAPKQMGDAFLKVYRGIVERRLAAKAAHKSALKAGDQVKAREHLVTADVLKICVNGSFGKLGSQYSDLYAPDLMIQVTITGQLALLMLIETLEGNGIPVVSANTDGVVIRCPARLRQECDYLMWEWEQATGFETEETQYQGIYSRDVNNYIALKVGGGAKLKGAYAAGGLAKNPANQICVDAVLAYLAKGTPIEETILDCRDITRFVTLRNVTGGAVKEGRYLGRAVRWYYSTTCPGEITYRENGNAVARSAGGRPVMVLPEEFPEDIDFDWYIREARDILKQIGALPPDPPAQAQLL